MKLASQKRRENIRNGQIQAEISARTIRKPKKHAINGSCENIDLVENLAQVEIKCQEEKKEAIQEKSFRFICKSPQKKGTKEKCELKRRTFEKLPKLSVRFANVQHIPNYDKDNHRKGFRCKLKGCGKQTTVYCETCEVHLCFLPGKQGRNCFRVFHVLDEN